MAKTAEITRSRAMWRLRFPKIGGGYLITKTGLHSIEAAAFYAEAILSDVRDHMLVDEETGVLVSASLIDSEHEYGIEDYWQSALLHNKG